MQQLPFCFRVVSLSVIQIIDYMLFMLHNVLRIAFPLNYFFCTYYSTKHWGKMFTFPGVYLRNSFAEVTCFLVFWVVLQFFSLYYNILQFMSGINYDPAECEMCKQISWIKKCGETRK